MLTEPILGGTVGTLPGTGANLAAFKWTQLGAGGNNLLGNGVANIVFSPAVNLTDIEELALNFVCSVNGVVGALGTGVVVRLRWCALVAGTYIEEPVEQQGVPAAGVRRDLINIKEWGPQTVNFSIYRPANMHFVQIGMFSNGAPGALDEVTLTIERQRGSAIQQGGT